MTETRGVESDDGECLVFNEREGDPRCYVRLALTCEFDKMDTYRGVGEVGRIPALHAFAAELERVHQNRIRLIAEAIDEASR